MRERVRRLAHRLTAPLMDECQAGWQGRGEEHPSNRIQSGAAERGTGGGWGEAEGEGGGEGGCSGRKEKCSGDEGGRGRQRERDEKTKGKSCRSFDRKVLR